MKIHSFPVKLIILVLLNLTLTSCSGAPASPTLTPPPSQTATPETPSQTSTPAESPLPGIEGLTHNLEEKYWKFEDKKSGQTLVFAEQSVGKEIKNGILELGVWDLNAGTGELKINTSHAPQSIKEAKQLKKIAVVLNHPMEGEMIRTIHIATEQSLKKTENYNPANEFSNITITDKVMGQTIENVNVTPKDWMIHAMYNKIELVDIFPTSRKYDLGNNNRFYIRNRAARPIQVAINGTGYFNVQFFEEDILKFDLLNIPVVAMDTDGSIIPLTAIEKISNGPDDITEYLNIAKRPYLSPTLVVNGNYMPSEKNEGNLASDPELRELLMRLNQPIMSNFNNYNIKLQKMPNIVKELFLSTAYVSDLSR